MNTRSWSAVVLVVALVAVSGCLGGEVGEVPDPLEVDAEDVELNEFGAEVVSSSVEALEETGSYRFTGETTVGLSTPLFDYRTVMGSEGAVNRSNRRAKVETDGATETALAEALSDETEFYSTAYVEDETTYLRRVENGSEGEWRTEEFGFRENETADVDAARLVEALEKENVSLEGATTLDGEEVLVVSADEAATTALDHMLEQLDRRGEAEELRTRGVDDVEAFDEVQLYLWVERESRRPVKVAAYLSVDMGGDGDGGSAEEGGGGSGFEGTAVFSSEAEFQGFDEAVEVGAPEDLDV